MSKMAQDPPKNGNGDAAYGNAALQRHLSLLRGQWEPLLRRAALGPGACLASGAVFDPGRLVIIEGDRVLKLVIAEETTTASLRCQTLSGEHEILGRLRGIPGIPRPLSFSALDMGCILEMEKVPGAVRQGLPSLGAGLAITLYRLLVLLHRMARRGIAHNDLNENNVLVGSDRQVWLIDCDQASSERYVFAMARGTLGLRCGSSAKIHGSIRSMIAKKVKRFLPGIVARLRRLKERFRNRLPSVRKCNTRTLQSIREAWQIAQGSTANAPGRNLAYYALDTEGVHFPGERPWKTRWHVLSTLTDYSGKRVLELGCNMGLLATHLAKHSGPSAVMGIDIDAEILRSAKLVVTAFGVEVDFMRVDFDDERQWESGLAKFAPDIVFALNVLNWVKDKDRLLAFLGRFNEVVVEGHDSCDIETRRLREVGFQKVRLVTISERGRPLLHATKSRE
jgi:2-polyprenyl-3-methyl-5-hydroxy-6-metoxy-1,4-benzoquinol methylase/tRNA A-37 threonylcarbamoyl transferase component Bud32